MLCILSPHGVGRIFFITVMVFGHYLLMTGLRRDSVSDDAITTPLRRDSVSDDAITTPLRRDSVSDDAIVV